MKLKINTYDIKRKEFMTQTEKNIGKFKLIRDEIVPIDIHDKIRESYTDKSLDTLPKYDYCLFTKKPITLEFVFVTDENQKTDTDEEKRLLNKILNVSLAVEDLKVKKLKTKLKECDNVLNKANESKLKFTKDVLKYKAKHDKIKDALKTLNIKH